MCSKVTFGEVNRRLSDRKPRFTATPQQSIGHYPLEENDEEGG